LFYLRENNHSWNIIKLSVNEAYMERLDYHHLIKSGNPSSPKKFQMEGHHNHQFKSRSNGMELILEIPNSIFKSLYVKESYLIIFKQLMKGFQESLQYLLHSFPNPHVSIFVEIDFLVKDGIYLLWNSSNPS
jgi:hypothetical protein